MTNLDKAPQTNNADKTISAPATKKHSWKFALGVTAFLVTLPVVVWLDLSSLTSNALTRQASDLGAMISDIRAYYANNIVSRIKQADGKVVLAHNYQDIPGGVPIPATLSLELGSVLGSRVNSVSYRFISDYPFASRPAHSMDSFEMESLKSLRESGNPKASKTQLTGGLFNSSARLALPVVMGQACVDCHNSHPESPKRDWKSGDVRGIQVISVEQPLANNVWALKYLLIYFLLAASGGLVIVLYQRRQAEQFHVLNKDLKESNDFLASISMKISRYLSPQIYKSIFSGKLDAVITTERKKLTIFFSDIKDFTSTTEKMQPEELTALLNDYFTEMSAIALKYGATIDKFIGDAIVAFFGDPNTLGPKGDALACVKMAIEMQRRLTVLNDKWRGEGIEKPFKVRIGINSGYCNVGNFGSNDRMDYTIIGQEANLAARLESISQPGGIVLSYETYALVKDEIQARPLEPISLKGIDRSIIPYEVLNIHENASTESQTSFDQKGTGFEIHIDANLTPEERKNAYKALENALSSIKSIDKN